MIQASLTGVANAKESISAKKRDSNRAMLNAIKSEGFSLRETLQYAIRIGRPAPGVELQDLSIIARTVKRRKGMRQPLPLLRLAGGVTYVVDQQAMTMRVGFTSRSPRWVIAAALKQQAGFTRPVTFGMQQYFRHVGAQRLFGRLMRGEKIENQDWTRRVLFLRSSTTQFKIPARPIIEPFWNNMKISSAERIRANFRMIMSGGVAPAGNLIDPHQPW